MRGRKRSQMPASLMRLSRRFAAWRKKRDFGQRIPESLWKAAVESVSEHGLHCTARALKLDYYSLKKRVDRASSDPSGFVELPASPLLGVPECVIEWEDASGSRMRVQLKGQVTPDLLALSRSFWGAD